MKSFGFSLLTLVIIIGLGIGGYFAYRSMTNPASYLPNKTQTVGDLHPIVSNPDTGMGAAGANATVTAVTTGNAPAANSTTPSSSDSSNAALAANLNTLIAAKTLLKTGSKGVSVGYIEQFMSVYFKKNSKVDNVFGKTLAANVATFQKQNKITATGQVGSATMKAMVVWLSK